MRQAAYLGPEGTFSEQALYKWLKQYSIDAEPVPYSFIPDILTAAAEGKIEFGLVPIENSIEGTVSLALDYLYRSLNCKIVGEVILSVDHNLAAAASLADSMTLFEIKYIYSHPQALSQCSDFLTEKLSHCELRQSASTAEAASKVSELKSASSAAICSSFAADKYGLRVVIPNIQDYPNNQTRFIVTAKSSLKLNKRGAEGKTSMLFSLPRDHPGGLYLVLKDFADRDINLTKIESRPSKNELGQYVFYLDCEGYADEEPVAGVIESLKKKTSILRILGSYPKAGG